MGLKNKDIADFWTSGNYFDFAWSIILPEIGSAYIFENIRFVKNSMTISWSFLLQ